MVLYPNKLPESERVCSGICTLCVTANMIYSDMAYSIAEDMGYKTPAEVPSERMALSCYRKAVAYLRDKDMNFHVRHYFKKRMYGEPSVM